MTARRHPQEKPRTRDRFQIFNDKLDDAAVDAAVQGAIEQLKRAMESNPNRLIKTLVKEEVRNIAIGAISSYVKKRSEQIAELNDELPSHLL